MYQENCQIITHICSLTMAKGYGIGIGSGAAAAADSRGSQRSSCSFVTLGYGIGIGSGGGRRGGRTGQPAKQRLVCDLQVLPA